MIISGTTIQGGTIRDISVTRLYDFSTFTFTTGNIVGPTGANAAQLFANSYSNVGNTWLTTSSTFNVINGYQYWTVPETATYQITAAGSRSGIATWPGNAASGNLYGRGATVSGTFALTQGQTIAIAVGQPSANTSNGPYSSVGGGGGTFVVLGNTFPLVVAGGGGGSGSYSTVLRAGANAATTTAGTSSWGGAPGGINGLGGNSHINAAGTVSLNQYDGGAGGGFLGNGAYGGNNALRPGPSVSGSFGQGGLGFASGLTGGIYSLSYAPPATSSGGFGGGGGASPIAGGGGGGYSGGGGGYATTQPVVDAGGAGGAWVAANAVAIATYTGTYNSSATFGGLTVTTVGTLNAGPGYVTITKV